MNYAFALCFSAIAFNATTRPFKVPFSPLFPILGIVCCGGLMIFSMQFLTTSALLFPIWVGIGALIYFHYGYKKNRITDILEKRQKSQEKEKIEYEEQPITNEV